MQTSPKQTSPKRHEARAYLVSVDSDVCDGCGICIFFCKPDVFELSQELSRRGFFPARPVRGSACTNCRLCVLGCPQLAIAVVGREGEP